MEIKLEQVTNLEQFNGDGTWKVFLFRSYDSDKYIGEICVEKVIASKLEPLLSDEFFFQDGKAIPYVTHIMVMPEYKGRKIAGKLVEFVNNYFKEHDEISLHSGVLNSVNAVRVWEKLVEEEKAEEIEYQGKRRWKLF